MFRTSVEIQLTVNQFYTGELVRCFPGRSTHAITPRVRVFTVLLVPWLQKLWDNILARTMFLDEWSSA